MELMKTRYNANPLSRLEGIEADGAVLGLRGAFRIRFSADDRANESPSDSSDSLRRVQAMTFTERQAWGWPSTLEACTSYHPHRMQYSDGRYSYSSYMDTGHDPPQRDTFAYFTKKEGFRLISASVAPTVDGTSFVSSKSSSVW